MRHAVWLRILSVGMALLACPAGLAWAQVTPAAGYTPPDDTPSIRVGVTLFADYTYTQNPQITDADGNSSTPARSTSAASYINVTGNISHIVAFRITPDITRQSGLLEPRRRQQRVERQPGVPHQVRVRAVQPRRLDDEGLVGAARHPADALGRLRGRHLSLSVPGHGVRRA